MYRTVPYLTVPYLNPIIARVKGWVHTNPVGVVYPSRLAMGRAYPRQTLSVPTLGIYGGLGRGYPLVHGCEKVWLPVSPWGQSERGGTVLPITGLLEYLGGLTVTQGPLAGQPLELYPWERRFITWAPSAMA